MAAKKTTSAKKEKATLGEVIMVYVKSSSHWYALVQPEIVSIEDISFIRGKQVTGKEGHRMEGRRTLIPLEHVSALVEFASEDDLWSEPQSKYIRPPEEERQGPVLTSHEQLQGPQPGQGGGGRNRRRRGHFHKKRHQGGGYRYPDEHGPRNDRGDI